MNEEFIIISCPYCNVNIFIYINEINCHIFRCGIIKETGLQIQPHETKEVCDKLYQNNLIYGCGKPFKLHQQTKEPEQCDYI